MPVVFATEPVGSRVALADALNALGVTPTPATAAHLAAVASSQAPPPLPVYSFRLDDLAAGKGPRSESPIAWNYLLAAGGQPVRTAEVVSGPHGGYTFAAISAAHAAETNQAIQVAEQDPLTAGGQYEMRLVRIPSLYVTALWLKAQKGNADLFVVIPPTPDGFQPHTVSTATDFLKLLQTAATQKSQVPPPPISPAPTN